VRKASRDALSRSEEDRPSAFFPGPPITLTRWTTEPVERRTLPCIWRFFIPEVLPLRDPDASKSWDTSGRLSSSLAHLDPQGPQTWRVLHIAVRSTPMGARRMISNTGSATALGPTRRRAWRGDGTGSHPSPSLLDRQRSSEGRDSCSYFSSLSDGKLFSTAVDYM
jgi:hypothetical protein